jgi:hypothetical protein
MVGLGLACSSSFSSFSEPGGPVMPPFRRGFSPFTGCHAAGSSRADRGGCLLHYALSRGFHSTSSIYHLHNTPGLRSF